MGPGYGNGYGSWDHMGGSGWWGGIVMLIILLAVVALIVWAVVAITRGHRAPPPPGVGHLLGNAQTILDHRLATGEISVEEYQRLSDALRTASMKAREPDAAEGAGAGPGTT